MALRMTCGRCGKCYVEPVVPVTDADVRRLTKATGLKADRIVRFFASNEFSYDGDHQGWIATHYGRRVMGLRKPKDGRCLFLDWHNHCLIYDARPMTCRTFPYELGLDDDGGMAGLELNADVDCGRRSGSGPDMLRLRKDSIREEREDAEYYRRVGRWNRHVVDCGHRPVGKRDFLRFLGLLR